jgi:PRTRC genetic system protein B
MTGGARAAVKLKDGSALVPRRAIILYESGSSAFATVHDIEVSDETPQLGAGKPMSAHTLRSLHLKLRGSHGRRGVLPESVLALDEETLIWHEPPQIRYLAFRMSDQFPSRSIGTVAGRVPCPGVVFMVRGRDWLVLAYKGKGRPEATTRMFHAPMFNVSQDFRICAGTVKRPASCAVTAIGEWSRAFFGTFFSHANYHGVVRLKGDVMGLWREQLKAPSKTFPERVLKDAGLTLGELVERAGL